MGCAVGCNMKGNCWFAMYIEDIACEVGSIVAFFVEGRPTPTVPISCEAAR